MSRYDDFPSILYGRFRYDILYSLSVEARTYYIYLVYFIKLLFLTMPDLIRT